MQKIKGTVISIGDFLFNKNTSVTTEIAGKTQNVIRLKKGRKLFIPDYQREIRWTKEILFSLMNDIAHNSKFLGNIILSHKDEKNFEIIDGQQRIVSLLMLVDYIRENYEKEITDIEETVEVSLNGFSLYNQFRGNGYRIPKGEEEAYNEADWFDQISRLTDLFSSIKASEILSTQRKARKFIENLLECSLNVVVSEEGHSRMTSGYYIDVNLKGIKLDIEDIFKGYLFSSNSTKEIKQAWINLKQSWIAFNISCTGDKTKTVYPLMKILNHYIHCQLLSKPEFKEVKMNEDFNLVEPCKVNGTQYYKGEHIINVIDNDTYILELLQNVEKYIFFLRNICNVSSGVSKEIRVSLKAINNESKIEILNNLLKKVILDKVSINPKSLLAKFYHEHVLNGVATKKELEEAFGIYFFIVIFSLFTDKKELAAIKNILVSDRYYEQLLRELATYFSRSEIYKAKRIAISKWNSNFDNEDLKFKCKSLATIYNYFHFDGERIIFKDKPENSLKNYLNNDEMFSVEHFIVSQSEGVMHCLENGEEYEYFLPNDIKAFHNYIFNYIFIPGEINRDVLKNYYINDKLKLIKREEYLKQIQCEYSLMIIDCAIKCFELDFDFTIINEKSIGDLEKYWAAIFSKQYDKYVSFVLDNIFKKFELRSVK